MPAVALKDLSHCPRRKTLWRYRAAGVESVNADRSLAESGRGKRKGDRWGGVVGKAAGRAPSLPCFLLLNITFILLGWSSKEPHSLTRASSYQMQTKAINGQSGASRLHLPQDEPVHDFVPQAAHPARLDPKSGLSFIIQPCQIPDARHRYDMRPC